MYMDLCELAKKENTIVVPVSAQIEADLESGLSSHPEATQWLWQVA